MKTISQLVEPSSLKQTVILKPESFDSYSKNYNELLNNSLLQTGYDAYNLVSAKLHKLRSLFTSLSEKPFRLLDFGCGVGNLYG